MKNVKNLHYSLTKEMMIANIAAGIMIISLILGGSTYIAYLAATL